MKSFLKITTLILVLIVCKSANAQLDTIHWLPPMHGRLPSYTFDNYLYISTPSISPVQYTIKVPGGILLDSGTVSNSNPVNYFLGSNLNNTILIDTTELNIAIQNKGILFVSNSPCYVSYRCHAYTTLDSRQATITSLKGNVALGKEFRVGGIKNLISVSGTYRSSFFSIIATEDSTTVDIDDIPTGVVFKGSNALTGGSGSINLNYGESAVFSIYTNSTANTDGILGIRVKSNKDISLLNGFFLGNIGTSSGAQDMGIDQSVPIDELGSRYILVKGSGATQYEQVIIIAHEDQTKIYLNGSSLPVSTINSGEYLLLNGSNYSSNGNLLIESNQTIYCYQHLLGSSSASNGDLNFIPPISCGMPKRLDNIPSIDSIGNQKFTGGVSIISKATDTIKITNQTNLVTLLPGSGNAVSGNSNWRTHVLNGLTGKLSIESTGSIACCILGSNASAGYAAYFSGFGNNVSASFTHSDTVYTENYAQFSITGNAPNNAIYNWDWDNGTHNYIAQQDKYFVKWSTPGWKTITLTIESGSCIESVIDSIFVTSHPSICSGQSTLLYSSLSNSQNLWSTGDTTSTINVSPSSTTKYWVRQIAGTDTIVDTITVNVLNPTINASTNSLCNPGDSVMLWTSKDSSVTQSCGGIPASLQNGLMAYYPFCGNANDVSGFGNHGTVLNAALANDRNGNPQSAYYFDGSSKITVPSSAQISDSLNTQVTFSAWINVESYPNGFGPILSKNGPITRQFEVWVESNKLGFWSTQIYGSATTTVPYNTWLHYVVTFDQGTVKYYLNSTLIQTSSYTTTSLAGNNSVFEIGHDSPGVLELFKGYIDDVAIWNRVLSPADVANLYNYSTNYSNTLWSTGETTDTIWINPTTDTTIWVSSTLGNVTCVDSIDIEVNNCLTITESDTTICLGDTLSLSANLNLQAGCLMNISYTGIPPGDPIPGFTYGGLYNGHYYYVYDTPTSWTQGEQLCRQNGGYLVCIDDINENTFVSNLVPSFSNKNIWIGLYRDSTTCQFRWLNCINIAYTNWRPGEPNSGPCGEPYAQIIRGCSYGLNTWNNLGNNASNGSCYSNMVPILEIDPTIGSTASTSILWSTGDTTNTINVSPTSTTKYWVRKTIDSDTIIDTITVHVLDPTINATSTTVCSASDSVMLWINSDSTSTPSACGDLPSGLNNGLVAWYPFCGNANDESSIGNNGTVYGATLTTDRNGNPNSAYEFNGSSYIEAQNNAALNFSSSHTYSVWVRITGSNTWQHFITRNDGASYPLLQQFYLRRGSGGSIELQNSPNGNIVHTSNTLNSTNPQWHHIVAVVDVNALKSYLYLDGVKIDSSSLSTPLNYNNNNGKLWIGVENPIVSLPSGPQYFQGKLDDIGIWNRALTQSEITQLYNGSNSSSTLWSTGETTDTIWINPNSDTTIWVSSTFGNVTCVDSIDIDFLNPEIQCNTLGVCAPGDTAMLWVENESHSVTWSTGETSDTIFVTPVAATSYWVQFTSFNGVCSDSIEIDVSEPIEIFGDSLLCKGDSVLLYVDASSFFSLSDTLYFNDFENIVGNEFSATTTTTFSSSSLLGNFSDQTITLSLSSLPLDSIRLSFDLWIHDSWDGNSTGVNGTDSLSIHWNQYSLLHTTFNNHTGGIQSYPNNYPASNPSKTGSILSTSSLCSGQGSSKYHLSFDINNTSFSGIISFDGTPSQSLCDESWSIDNVLIEALNGVETNSVLWSTGHTSDSIWVTPTQTTTYWVSSTDQYGCESTDSITVFVSDIQSTISVQEPSCNGSSDGQAQINPTGGITPYTFLWSNGSGSSMANNLSSDTVWVAVTDSIGCSAVDTFFIDQPDSLIISNIQTSNYNGFNVSCNGGSDGSASTTVIGGTMPYYYNWNNNTYTTSSISNLGAGTYVLQVTDTNGCTVNETIVLAEPNPIIISPSITSNYNGYAISCYGESDGSADVTIAGGIAPYSILWSNGVPTSSITNVPSGSYSVIITDDNSCVDSAQINLNQPNPLTGTAVVTDASCYGNADGSLDLTLSGGAGSYFITWSTGDTSLSVYNLPSGWYTYSVISSNNCEIADSVYINQPTPLTIELDTVHPTCINSFDGELNVVAMGGTPGYNYFLNGNAFTGSIQGLGTDSLRILAVDFNNCDTLFVIAMPPVRDPCIFIPNWFSPNGNGKEDLWLIEGFEYGQLKLRIFNVYGQQIYYTESQNYVPWDGTYNGKELPNGDYYYVIESENYFSQYTGYVTILR